MPVWAVKLTACYPNCWKVYPTSFYKESNETHFYFKLKQEAEKYAKELNNHHEYMVGRQFHS